MTIGGFGQTYGRVTTILTVDRSNAYCYWTSAGFVYAFIALIDQYLCTTHQMMGICIADGAAIHMMFIMTAALYIYIMLCKRYVTFACAVFPCAHAVCPKLLLVIDLYTPVDLQLATGCQLSACPC